MTRFVDSNVFVYHLAGDPAYGERARSILKAVQEGEEAVTSSLVISQVCGYMKWKKKADRIPAFLSLLRSMPSMVKAETTFSDFVRAHEMIGEKGDWGAWDDYVIAAQMERAGAKEVYSNDPDFDGIEGIRRVF
ncbi:MAG: type II toxin-antitoxin system VapC family toxin [Nitrososphaerota archaeon]|nr:type II toxin-antitoxin system VapC family toxin [Nitrososphaerota archaeon]